MPTPQNGQTHSSNSPATVDELFEYVWPFFGVSIWRVNMKNLWKCIFRVSREWVFHIFSRLYSIIGAAPWYLDTPWIFVDHVTIFSSGTMQHLRWSSLWQKSMLETIVNCCYRELPFKCGRAPRSDSERHR